MNGVPVLLGMDFLYIMCKYGKTENMAAKWMRRLVTKKPGYDIYMPPHRATFVHNEHESVGRHSIQPCAQSVAATRISPQRPWEPRRNVCSGCHHVDRAEESVPCIKG